MNTRMSELRLNRNKTQEDIAKLLGVARTTYAMYEQGKREMDYQLLIKLADYYKVSLDFIFRRTDNPILIESLKQDEIEFINKNLTTYREIKTTYWR
ncbi:helix-turn-helix transcriptional regulator [Alkalihalophilus lindianensis]|uniref:Helix-turn-helix transcriptional regulator n=1 Tax=Alkalihalophilus lindianensis TaxID=1630542 RepID=A0ABU3X7K0_9BACI|nr:helix-turn-helix transcriptional regulator [Alkalihalophilus lindianensis]MDV2683778.1 helix-turn-helix transcriptional regulator [Alkalihalophilus lindianensis]MDV2683844.1 helix-turn-helix transcriptional regulator [Alkalihalophilus lindianensis]